MGVFRLVMLMVARPPPPPLNMTGWRVGRRLFSFVVVDIKNMTASAFTSNCHSISRMECFMERVET